MPTQSWLAEVPSVQVPEPSLPPEPLRYRALSYFEPKDTRLIILGQDPYPAIGKANGLAFGISDTWYGHRLRSSFGSIWAELVASYPRGSWVRDLNKMDTWATLESWAQQGVLLLNTRLSVEPGKPLSHAHLGWEAITLALLVKALREPQIAPICMAWGAEARKMLTKAISLADRSDTPLLCYSHPCKFSNTRNSKYAKAFIGSKCFGVVNNLLLDRGQKQINFLKF